MNERVSECTEKEHKTSDEDWWRSIKVVANLGTRLWQPDNTWHFPLTRSNRLTASRKVLRSLFDLRGWPHVPPNIFLLFWKHRCATPKSASYILIEPESINIRYNRHAPVCTLSEDKHNRPFKTFSVLYAPSGYVYTAGPNETWSNSKYRNEANRWDQPTNNEFSILHYFIIIPLVY